MVLGSAVDFQSRGLAEAVSSAEAFARRAVALDDTEAHCWLSYALRRRGDYEGGLAAAERALTISPNLFLAHTVRAAILIFSGHPEEGVVALKRSFRFDPRNPRSVGALNHMVLGLYFLREYEAAIETAKRIIRLFPEFPVPYRWLTAALGQLGRTAEAKEALETAIAIAPAVFDMYVRQRPPWLRPEDHAHMLEGLRKAGWAG